MADLFGYTRPPKGSTNPYGDAPQPPCQKHSDTSRAAAEAIKPSAKTLRGKVYQTIKDCGSRGATDPELQAALHLEGSTQRPRRVELVEQGLVRDSGLTRETPSGRSATVWVAT